MAIRTAGTCAATRRSCISVAHCQVAICLVDWGVGLRHVCHICFNIITSWLKSIPLQVLTWLYLKVAAVFSCVLCTSRCSISQEAVKSSRRNVWPSPSPGSTRRGGLERKRAESLSFVYKSWVGLSASLLDNPADVVHVVQLLLIEKAERLKKETEAGCVRSWQQIIRQCRTRREWTILVRHETGAWNWGVPPKWFSRHVPSLKTPKHIMSSLGGATTSINSWGVPKLSLLAQLFNQVSRTSLAAARGSWCHRNHASFFRVTLCSRWDWCLMQVSENHHAGLRAMGRGALLSSLCSLQCHATALHASVYLAMVLGKWGMVWAKCWSLFRKPIAPFRRDYATYAIYASSSLLHGWRSYRLPLQVLTWLYLKVAAVVSCVLCTSRCSISWGPILMLLADNSSRATQWSRKGNQHFKQTLGVQNLLLSMIKSGV